MVLLLLLLLRTGMPVVRLRHGNRHSRRDAVSIQYREKLSFFANFMSWKIFLDFFNRAPHFWALRMLQILRFRGRFNKIIYKRQIFNPLRQTRGQRDIRVVVVLVLRVVVSTFIWHSHFLKANYMVTGLFSSKVEIACIHNNSWQLLMKHPVGWVYSICIWNGLD